MIPIWLHAFSVWYFVSLAFTIKWSWNASVLSGAMISVGLLSDLWQHLSVYVYWDHVGRKLDPMLISYIFIPAFVVGISSLYLKFVLYTNASVLGKVLLAVSFVVVTIVFTPADDTSKDIYWHSNHAMLHFITGFVPWMCSNYLQEEKTKVS